MIYVLDYFSVLIYGVLIMTFFLDIRMTKKNILLILGCILFNGLLQFGFSYIFGLEFLEKSYPLIIHLPIIIFYRKVTVI